MREARRVQTSHDPIVVDPVTIVRSPRRGDHAVTWLVVAFVCLAVLVLGFALARSRTARPPKAVVRSASTAIIADEGFRVIRVLDGDTLLVVGQDEIELTLRLAGIDAPEKDQRYGNEATQFLESLLHEQVVHLDDIKREKFGRILAHAYLGSRWVSLEIVQHGCAWVYPDSESRALREAEAKARAQKTGLWSSESSVAPWEWRKAGQ